MIPRYNETLSNRRESFYTRDFVRADSFLEESERISTRWDQMGDKLPSLERENARLQERSGSLGLSESGIARSIVKRYFQNPPGGRNCQDSSAFRQGVIQKYGVMRDNGDIWDVVAGRYVLIGV